VLETKVVGRLARFHCTTEPETKLEPVAVNVKPGPPRVVLVGEIAVTVGAGGGTVGEVPPHPMSRDINTQARAAVSVARQAGPDHRFT
jgi:hypothetical protein